MKNYGQQKDADARLAGKKARQLRKPGARGRLRMATGRQPRVRY